MTEIDMNNVHCRYIVVFLPDETPGLPVLNVVAGAIRESKVIDTDAEGYMVFGYYDGDIEFKEGPGL